MAGGTRKTFYTPLDDWGGGVRIWNTLCGGILIAITVYYIRHIKTELWRLR